MNLHNKTVLIVGMGMLSTEIVKRIREAEDVDLLVVENFSDTVRAKIENPFTSPEPIIIENIKKDLAVAASVYYSKHSDNQPFYNKFAKAKHQRR